MSLRFKISRPSVSVAVSALTALFPLFALLAYRPAFNLPFFHLRLWQESAALCIPLAIATIFVVALVSRLLQCRASRQGGMGIVAYLLWQLAEYVIIVVVVSAVIAACIRVDVPAVCYEAAVPLLLLMLPAWLFALYAVRIRETNASSESQNSHPIQPEQPANPECPEYTGQPEYPEYPGQPEQPEQTNQPEQPSSPAVTAVSDKDSSDLPAGTDKIQFHDEKGTLKLEVEPQSVFYIEAAGNYVTIGYHNGARLARQGMRSSLKAMTPLAEQCGLVRCHRSYFINPAKIKSLKRDGDNVVAHLDSPDANPIPVTKSFLPDVTRLTPNSEIC